MNTRLMRIALTALLLISAAPKRESQDLKEGYYYCEGSTAPGKTYSCAVTVQKQEEVYIVKWLSDDGVIVGIGILDRDRLSISYGVKGSPTIAVALMVIDGSSLKGGWSNLPGDGKIHPENWKFMHKFPKPNKPEKVPDA